MYVYTCKHVFVHVCTYVYMYTCKCEKCIHVKNDNMSRCFYVKKIDFMCTCNKKICIYFHFLMYRCITCIYVKMNLCKDVNMYVFLCVHVKMKFSNISFDAKTHL